MKRFSLLLFSLLLVAALPAQIIMAADSFVRKTDSTVIVGARRTAVYLPLLKDKRVAVVANQTSLIGSTHLVDSLVALKVDLKKIFCPEHGFRGDGDAGETIKNQKDKKTGLPVVSLYGEHKKPTVDDLENVDIVLFDLQDVGVRFFTYVSTMTYVMEACAEQKKTFIVLDRPNPNGYYVDGPVLEDKYKSFVGMHAVPVVHGLTLGEYAQMLNGEGWLKGGVKCSLNVVTVENYSHKDLYQLPVKPSPNLPNMEAVYLYPSVCLFEGTAISVGRGTDWPFQVIGHPNLQNAKFTFTPHPIIGASKKPPFNGQLCYGHDLRDFGKLYMPTCRKLYLYWLQGCYKDFSDKTKFFNSYFTTLCGTDSLRQQIEQGKSEDEIRKSWEPGLKTYKAIRKKYLLYPDFE